MLELEIDRIALQEKLDGYCKVKLQEIRRLLEKIEQYRDTSACWLGGSFTAIVSFALGAQQCICNKSLNHFINRQNGDIILVCSFLLPVILFLGVSLTAQTVKRRRVGMYITSMQQELVKICRHNPTVRAFILTSGLYDLNSNLRQVDPDLANEVQRLITEAEDQLREAGRKISLATDEMSNRLGQELLATWHCAAE